MALELDWPVLAGVEWHGQLNGPMAGCHHISINNDIVSVWCCKPMLFHMLNTDDIIGRAAMKVTVDENDR